MTLTERTRVFARAFGALTKVQQRRLREAAKARRPICCGSRANIFYDPSDGAG